MTILDEIIATKKDDVEGAKSAKPLSYWRAIAEEMAPARDFYAALQAKAGKAIIAECKKRSPSKGLLCPDYDATAIALRYEAAGAAAISVLTDTPYFAGSLDDLRGVSHAVDCPTLRKDFLVDEYQIHEARANGADTFLLMASVLDYAQIQYFLEIGREYGMEALVETHTEEEIAAVAKTDAKIIGINNRNLKTMTVDLATGKGLAAKLLETEREELILVCESGIKSGKDLHEMHAAGFAAFLIGEHLMLADDLPKAFLELTAE